MPYDAFISYSHAADGQLAPALQAALQGFAKPWYRRRALHLFRDQTSLAASPGLWPAIEDALRHSRYFLLLASPEAARSRWVQQEVGWWLKHNSPQSMLIGLTDGVIARGDGAKDFDWVRTDALPPNLRGVFTEDPLWVDLRWANGPAQLSLNHPEFKNALAALAAPLRNMAKEDLIGEDMRQHRRTMRLTAGAIVTLTLLLLAAVVGAGFAVQQRAQAEAASQLALARQLAAQAETERTGGLDTRLLLSLEANRLNPGAPEAQGSLLDLLAEGADLEGFIPGLHQRVDVVSFRPDGKAIATSGPDGVWIWDVATRQPLAGPLGARRTVREPVAFSPDGTVLAASWQDGVVSLFDGTTYAPIGELTFAHPARFVAVVFSPDGKTLAAAGTWADAEAGTNAAIVFWRWDEREQLRTLIPPHDTDLEWYSAGVSALAFSPDGSTLVSGEASGRVCIWDGNTGDLRQWFVPFAGQILTVAFSPNAKTLAVGGQENRIHLYTVGSLQPVGDLIPPNARETYDPPAIREIAFTPDGFSVAAASEEGYIFRWDAISRKSLGEPLGGHGAPVFSLGFSPDGKRLVSGAANGTLAIWDLAPGPRLGDKINAAHEYIYGVAVSPDGQSVAGGDTTGVVSFWIAASKEPFGDDIAPSFAGVSALGFSPDGRLLATGDDFGYVTIWDTSSRQLVHGQMTGHKEWITALVFLKNGTVLASSSGDGTVRFWDVATGEPLGDAVTISDEHLFSLAASPDQRWLAAGTSTGVALIDAATRRQIGDILPGPAAGGQVTMVTFSPDGKSLTVGGSSGAVLIDVVSRRQIGALYLPQGGYTAAVAFNPDGSLLATGGSDGLIRLWDVATLQVIGQFPRGHKGLMTWLMFTADGRFLVSNDYDGDLVIWDMNINTWITQACQMAGRNLSAEEWVQYLGDEPYRKTCPERPEAESLLGASQAPAPVEAAASTVTTA